MWNYNQVLLVSIGVFLSSCAVRSSSKIEEVFTQIYNTGYWGKTESLSGGGSTLSNTRVLRKKLIKFFKGYGIRSLVDAPCGDFNWMKEMDFNNISYLGIDIVDVLIKENRKKYESDTIRFDHGNILEYNFPRVDLIICRDCLTHLTFDQAKKAIASFKRSGAVYLLSSTYPDTKINKDVKDGKESRPLNLELPPFNLPKPIEIINEGYAAKKDKSLGLWFLEDIGSEY